MDSIRNLRRQARILRRLLEQYASADPEVRAAYARIAGLLDEVEAGAIDGPREFPCGALFFGAESHLPAYRDLMRAAVHFVDALETVACVTGAASPTRHA